MLRDKYQHSGNVSACTLCLSCQTVCPVKIFDGAKKVEIANMLEEVQGEADCGTLAFRPFEIKTLKITY